MTVTDCDRWSVRFAHSDVAWDPKYFDLDTPEPQDEEKPSEDDSVTEDLAAEDLELNGPAIAECVCDQPIYRVQHSAYRAWKWVHVTSDRGIREACAPTSATPKPGTVKQ